MYVTVGPVVVRVPFTVITPDEVTIPLMVRVLSIVTLILPLFVLIIPAILLGWELSTVIAAALIYKVEFPFPNTKPWLASNVMEVALVIWSVTLLGIVNGNEVGWLLLTTVPVDAPRLVNKPAVFT